MEEYRRNLINSICAEKFDRELFRAISTEIINQLNLSDYIKNIVLSNDLNKGYGGSYSYKGDIVINENQGTSDIITYYKAMFFTLFHEIRHIEQYKLIDKYYNYYSKLPKNHVYTLEEEKEITKIHVFIISNIIKRKNERIYKKKHNLFSIEHDANYYGYLDSSNFLRDFFSVISTKVDILKNFYLLSFLIDGYKIKINGKLKSPYEQIDYQFRDNIIKNNSLSNYERLILGLPIDKNLYAELDHMRLSLKFPDNFETYIKNC